MSVPPHARDVQTRLKRAFACRVPSGGEIAERAIRSGLAGHEHDREWIKRNFSSLVEDVQVLAYRRYLDAEEEAGRAALTEVFTSLVTEGASAQAAIEAVAGQFNALDKFFLGLTQGRRPRAGKAFEQLIRVLFTQLGYPFTPQAIINGQPDFVLPSETHFRRNPMDCVIFTVKRTLRERWRQIVTEGTRGLGFFLATIDEKIATRDLDEMLRARIHIVVPDTIKDSRSDYVQADNVITFEQFFRFHLDPAVARWTAAGVVGGGQTP